jgi:hypothetical protein
VTFVPREQLGLPLPPGAIGASVYGSFKLHRHWFTSLWWNFGEYGDQSVHVHSCCGDADEIERAISEGRNHHDDSCDWVLIGVGRNCGGKKTRHWRQSLQDRVDAAEAHASYVSNR